MHRRSPILEKLAELFGESSAGLTGIASRAYSISLIRLLEGAGCTRGEAYENAHADLLAGDGTALVLVKERRSGDIQRVTVPLRCEAALFARIGRASPAARRAAWAALFDTAKHWPVPSAYSATWRVFCRERAERARLGAGWLPFKRSQLDRARFQLTALAGLLAWRQPALLRTVSAQLMGDSKFLENSAGALQALLAEATGGHLRSFAELGIEDNPRSVTFHGPLRLQVRGQWNDYGNHADAISISETDLHEATAIECAAPRCVTVENKTKFHELCRLGCGDLFVFTSYPNRATAEFLARLSPALPRYHFGDTDPWGFDVLRTLRLTLAGIPIAPLNMAFRPKPGAPPLSPRDRKKLTKLLADPILADLQAALRIIQYDGTKGDFEQETILVSGAFPYVANILQPFSRIS